MMTSILNSDNIKSHICRAYIEERTSKEGKPYYVKVEIWNMPGGEEYRLEDFLSHERLALLKLSVPVEQVV